MKWAARVDANQPDVVKALRAHGCSVQSLASVGGGVPDLLVGVASRNLLLEVKDGRRPPSARQLTPAQETWHAGWSGQVAVVESIDAALGLVGVGKVGGAVGTSGDCRRQQCRDVVVFTIARQLRSIAPALRQEVIAEALLEAA